MTEFKVNIVMSPTQNYSSVLRTTLIYIVLSLLIGHAGVQPGQGEPEKRVVQAHTGRVASVVISPASDIFVSAGWDGSVKLWDMKSLKLLRTFTLAEARFNGVVFSRDGRYLIAAGGMKQGDRVELGAIISWEVATGKVVFSRVTDLYQYGIWGLALSADGNVIATAGQHRVELWDAGTGEHRASFETTTRDDFYDVAFSPDGTLLAASSEDLAGEGIIKLWELQKNTLVKVLEDGAIIGAPLAFSPDGKRLVSGGYQAAKFWDVGSGKLLRSVKGSRGDIISIAVSPDGKLVAGASGEVKENGEGDLPLWDLEKCTLIRMLIGHKQCVVTVAFSPDGKYLVSGSDDQTVIVWTLQPAQKPK